MRTLRTVFQSSSPGGATNWN